MIAPRPSAAREVSMYFALRLVLFGLAFAAITLLGVDNGLVAALIALVVSGAAAYLLMVRQRDRVVTALRDRRRGRP